MSGVRRPALLFVVGLLGLAGCSDADTRPVPGPVCRISDFLGEWVDARRRGEGVLVERATVTVISGMTRTKIAYVVSRDFGQVSRQVLRQEFAALATRGGLPRGRADADQRVCAIQLIQPSGAAALVSDGNDALVLLEERGKTDPPVKMRLRRGPADLSP